VPRSHCATPPPKKDLEPNGAKLISGVSCTVKVANGLRPPSTAWERRRTDLQHARFAHRPLDLFVKHRHGEHRVLLRAADGDRQLGACSMFRKERIDRFQEK